GTSEAGMYAVRYTACATSWGVCSAIRVSTGPAALCATTVTGSPPPIRLICEVSTSAARSRFTSATGETSVSTASRLYGCSVSQRGRRAYSPCPAMSTATAGRPAATRWGMTSLQHQEPCQKPWTNTSVDMIAPSGDAWIKARGDRGDGGGDDRAGGGGQA